MHPNMDEFQGLLPAMHPTLMMGGHKKSIEAATNMQEQMLCATNRTRPPLHHAKPVCHASSESNLQLGDSLPSGWVEVWALDLPTGF